MSEQLNETKTREHHYKEDEEIQLLDLLIVLARHKKLVIGMPIICSFIALTISLSMTPIFTSTVKIMPPQQQGSGLAAAMLGQLGGLAGAAGGIAGLKNPNDLYVGILESRTIADNLIKRFNLKQRYGAETTDGTRAVLNKISEINNSKKDGLISISVDDKDPQFAADLANAYIEELTKLTQTMAVSDASKRRLFFEKQLKDAKDQLAEAEVGLRKTQEKTGMIQPDGQVQAIISSIAQLKGAIAAKEVQLKAMRTYATVQNPDVQRSQEELSALQEQLAKLERNHGSKDGDFMVPTGKLPEVGIEYVRRFRDVKYYETLFEMLAKQYELARVDESRDASMIQILDKAVAAEHKSKPKRALITLTGMIAGGLIGIFAAFILEAYTRSRKNPSNQLRWNELIMALSGRRQK